MTENVTRDQLSEMQGQPVYSSEGEKIGKVEEIFHDIDTDKAEWIGIGTGFFSNKRVLVPVAGTEVRGDGAYVGYTKKHVQDAPDIDGDEISQETEANLYSYYGIDYSEDRSGSGLPENEATQTSDATGTTDERNTDDGDRTVTRSEEELSVGTHQREAGNVRVKKWVETEKATETVPTRREEVSVERVPVSEGATAAGDLGDDELSIPLVEEEVVVEKRPIVKEELRIKKETVTEEQNVEADIRKERVDVDDSTRTPDAEVR